MRFALTGLALAAVFAVACGGGSGEPVEPFGITVTGSPAATGGAGEVFSGASFLVAGAEGRPVEGLEVAFDVEMGGGSVAQEKAVTDAQGTVQALWTLGNAPVPNTVRATILAGTPAESSVKLAVQGTLAEPVQPEFFGDVDAFMAGNGIEGSTEDLAFSSDGNLLLGVSGGLLSMDEAGVVTAVQLEGDAIGNVLGLAVDAAGNVWAADNSGKALRRIGADGKVETVLTDDGYRDLEAPNYVAVGPDGDIFLSDPCVGEIIRYDPGKKKVVGLLSFSLEKEGGPNGMAFDAAGETLYVLTENTGVLCSHADVDMKAPIAGLFSVKLKDDGFGVRQVVKAGIGLFGDGMAFDAEGNLYVVVDRLLEGALALDDSAVWILPEGGGDLYEFASLEDPLTDGIIANVAFGKGEFGAGKLYMALLSMPPFSPADKRGVMVVDVGIGGQPLFE